MFAGTLLLLVYTDLKRIDVGGHPQAIAQKLLLKTLADKCIAKNLMSLFCAVAAAMSAVVFCVTLGVLYES